MGVMPASRKAPSSCGAAEPPEHVSSSGRRRDGDVTRLLIIETAERLYAANGLDGVSLREIGEAADQRNTAVVQYHFGGRDGLIAAIFEHGSLELDELRAPLVAKLSEDSSLVDLAEAIVRPFAATASRDSHYVAFLARLMADRALRGLAAAGISKQRPSYRQLTKELKRRLDHLPRGVRDVRAATVMEFTVFALAAHGGAGAGEALRRVSFDRYVNDLVQVVAAMIAAPDSNEGH